MLLQDVFPPEVIKVNMESEEKEDAFKELVDYYCQSCGSSLRNDILEAINAREAKMSTGIYRGIAVPHGRTNAVSSIQGVLGISQKGVNYDALDGEPVHILFMIFSPIEESDKYLRLLKRLADMVEIRQFQTELQTQVDTQDAFNVIRKYEKTFSI